MIEIGLNADSFFDSNCFRAIEGETANCYSYYDFVPNPIPALTDAISKPDLIARFILSVATPNWDAAFYGQKDSRIWDSEFPWLKPVNGFVGLFYLVDGNRGFWMHFLENNIPFTLFREQLILSVFFINTMMI